MSKSAAELRAMARRSLDQARLGPPRRAAQKRQSAQQLLRQARAQELFEFSQKVGRANVTLAAFREHLRAGHRLTTSR